MAALPTVSAVIPTLNAARTLPDCLDALLAQDWPRDRLEILIVDAGSSDGTVELARRRGIDRILDNPLKTGEAGKAVGIRAATGDFILLIDSDNIAVGADWLRRMTRPFEDPEVMAAEVARFAYQRSDGLIDRWHAMSGVADPLTLYVGNYARESLLTGRWTGFPHECEERDGWQRVRLNPNAVPVLGANGFIVRREAFSLLPVGDYHFDLDFVYELARRGHGTVGRVDAAVRHRFCRDVRGFVAKTRRRADDYFFFASTGRRTYPWSHRLRRGVLLFAASTLTLVPLLVQMASGVRRRPDRAWLFHPVACWITLVVYGIASVRGRVAPKMLDREGWRQ